MRSLYADRDYFEFLDSLNIMVSADVELASSRLELEFPGLRNEEAKAILVDWRARK